LTTPDRRLRGGRVVDHTNGNGSGFSFMKLHSCLNNVLTGGATDYRNALAKANPSATGPDQFGDC